MYNISEIKDESYTNFMEKLETTIISNNNFKEVHGELIDSPSEYNIVSCNETDYLQIKYLYMARLRYVRYTRATIPTRRQMIVCELTETFYAATRADMRTREREPQ